MLNIAGNTAERIDFSLLIECISERYVGIHVETPSRSIPWNIIARIINTIGKTAAEGIRNLPLSFFAAPVGMAVFMRFLRKNHETHITRPKPALTQQIAFQVLVSVIIAGAKK